jgi:4-hydroxybenzoate polyprenyltransferase
VDFFRRHGKLLLWSSIVFYLIAMVLAFRQNVYTLIVTVTPLLIGSLYSHFRIKRIFIVKNLAVVFGLSCSILVVFTYFNHLDLFGILFWLFFITIGLINVIIFDVKDIDGDRVHRIRTVPGELGVHTTKMICWGLFFTSLTIFFQLVQLNLLGISLIPFLIYIAYYIHILPESKEARWWYYGILVDGEFLVLLVSTIVFSSIL